MSKQSTPSVHIMDIQLITSKNRLSKDLKSDLMSKLTIEDFLKYKAFDIVATAPNIYSIRGKKQLA